MIAQIVIEELKAIFGIIPVFIGLYLIFDFLGSFFFGRS